MTTLLDQAVEELKKRPEREQDDIARDILARLGAPTKRVPYSARGRGRAVMTATDPNDTFIDILTEEDIAAWYPDKDPRDP